VRRLFPYLTFVLTTIALVVGADPLAESLAGQAARPGGPVAIRGATILTVTSLNFHGQPFA
jgi:hypothetical protein